MKGIGLWDADYFGAQYIHFRCGQRYLPLPSFT